MGRVRRKFDSEFKLDIVRQILSGEATQSKICREHALSPNAVRRWIDAFESGQEIKDQPSAREKQLERENKALMAKVGELVMQVDHLKKLDSYLSQLKKGSTSVITAKNLKQSRGAAK
jgi:transposase-like protein